MSESIGQSMPAAKASDVAIAKPGISSSWLSDAAN
jgi:hypothetical protein